MLFGRLAELRTVVTGHFYRQALGRKEDYAPRPAAEVQQFIDAEHAESTYDPRYHGLYDDRFINPGDVKDLPSHPWSHDEVAAWFGNWPPADLKQQVEAYHERRSEYQLLRGLKGGNLTLKGKTFTFRGQPCSRKDVDRLFTQVDGELDSVLESFQRLDRQAFLGHWSLACERGGSWGTELLERYRFHMAAQGLLQQLLGQQARLHAIFDVLSKNTQLPQADFQQIRDALAEIHDALTTCLDAARSCQTPALTNVPAGSALFTLIVDRGDTELSRLSGDSISGEWFGKLAARLDGVISRLRRVHFKSLGSLLAFQERLVSDGSDSSQHAFAPGTVLESEAQRA